MDMSRSGWQCGSTGRRCCCCARGCPFMVHHLQGNSQISKRSSKPEVQRESGVGHGDLPLAFHGQQVEGRRLKVSHDLHTVTVLQSFFPPHDDGSLSDLNVDPGKRHACWAHGFASFSHWAHASRCGKRNRTAWLLSARLRHSVCCELTF